MTAPGTSPQPAYRHLTRFVPWLLAAACAFGTSALQAHSSRVKVVEETQRNSGRLSVTFHGQTQPQSLYEESHALVIGASAYREPGWSTLKGVKDDVVAVKAALEQNGYAVQVVNDPTRDQLDKALRDFLHQHGQKKQNRLLVYFAGHGETLDVGAIGKVGYIVPVDAPHPAADEAGFKQKAYDMEMLETHAKSINAKHALFVFDSCFSGMIFSPSRSAVGPSPFITEMTTRPVQQFITSGDANQTVPDKSIFREQFVKALTTREADLNGDHHVTGSELGMYLQSTVLNRSTTERTRGNQTPMYGKSRIGALTQGDFVFASLKVEPTTASLPEASSPAPHATVKLGKRVALLVGIAKYNHFPGLINPINDVQLVRDSLLELGFDVTVATNTTRSELLRRLNELREKAGGSEAVLVYLSGLGGAKTHADYFFLSDMPIPADESMLAADALNISDTAVSMERWGSKLPILISDTGRAVLFGATRGLGGPKLTSVVFFSSLPGQDAFDGDGKHSPFAKSLAFFIRNKTLSLAEVLNKTSEAVKLESEGKQVPVFTASDKDKLSHIYLGKAGLGLSPAARR